MHYRIVDACLGNGQPRSNVPAVRLLRLEQLLPLGDLLAVIHGGHRIISAELPHDIHSVKFSGVEVLGLMQRNGRTGNQRRQHQTQNEDPPAPLLLFFLFLPHDSALLSTAV